VVVPSAQMIDTEAVCADALNPSKSTFLSGTKFVVVVDSLNNDALVLSPSSAGGANGNGLPDGGIDAQDTALAFQDGPSNASAEISQHMTRLLPQGIVVCVSTYVCLCFHFLFIFIRVSVCLLCFCT
jgi:hypothetical protein